MELQQPRLASGSPPPGRAGSARVEAALYTLVDAAVVRRWEKQRRRRGRGGDGDQWEGGGSAEGERGGGEGGDEREDKGGCFILDPTALAAPSAQTDGKRTA